MKLGILEEKLFNKIKLKTPKNHPPWRESQTKKLAKEKTPPFFGFFAVIAKKDFLKTLKYKKRSRKP